MPTSNVRGGRSYKSCGRTFSSSNFDFNELAIQINAQFTDLNDKVERISTKISHIEESITDQHAIINELEREISIIGNTLDKLSHINPNSFVIPSSQHTLTYLPRIDSPEPLVHLNLTHILLHLHLTHIHLALAHLHLSLTRLSLSFSSSLSFSPITL